MSMNSQKELECLAKFKENYEKLYEQYIITASKLTSVTKDFIRLLNSASTIINPAIYGNQWTAWYYRQWFFRDLRGLLDIWATLTESSTSRFVLSAFQHSSRHMGLDGEAETFKSWKSIIKKFDPDNKYIGWWTSEAAVDYIDRLRSLLSSLQVRVSEWYELSYWRNRGDITHGAEYKKLYEDVHSAFNLIAPKDLFVCEGEDIGRLLRDDNLEIQNLKERVAKLTEEKNKLQKELDELQDEFNDCSNNCREGEVTHEQLEAMRSQLDALQKEVGSLRETEMADAKKLADCKADNARLEEENKRLKEQIERELGDCHSDASDKVAALNKEIEALKYQNHSLQERLTVCQNNLDRVNGEYKELETENTNNKNLANLYKAERDDLKSFYTKNPIPREGAIKDLLNRGGVGVGKNFETMFKNSENFRKTINAVIVDYKNKVRSDQRNIANLGWYWNYLIDDVVSVLKDYLSEKENHYIKSKKIPASYLTSIRQ